MSQHTPGPWTWLTRLRGFLTRDELMDCTFKLGWHEGRMAMLAEQIRNAGGRADLVDLSKRGRAMAAQAGIAIIQVGHEARPNKEER